MFFWLNIAYLFVVITIVTLALSVIIRAVLPVSKRSAPTCGRCRYPYSGSDRCPECGAVYAVVGIHTPWLRLRLGPSLLEVAVSLLVLVIVIAGMVSALAYPIIASLGYKTTSSSCQLNPVQASGQFGAAPPSTPLPASLTLVSDVSTDARSHWTCGTIRLIVWSSSPAGNTMSYDTTSGHAYLKADIVRETIRVFDPTGKQVSQTKGALPGNADLAALFTAAGFDPTTDAAKPCLVDAADYVRQASLGVTGPALSTGAFPTTGLMPGASSFSPSIGLPIRLFGLSADATWFLLVILISGLVYLGLLLTIVRRRRSLLAIPSAPTV